MNLPPDILEKLAQAHLGVAIGDIFHLPQTLLSYQSTRSHRYCLLVALQGPPGGAPTRAHFIVGSRQQGSHPQLRVDIGETDLPKVTYFSFWCSSAVDLADLRRDAWRGRLDPARLPEIRNCIMSSRLVSLKLVVGRP